ncbi:MAG: response regulator transcription factor [Chloroflexota bacterium]
MLVDDNPTFLRIVEQFLKKHETIKVIAAVEGGEEALAYVHRLKPDVVLTDLAMPKVSGMETILRLRAAWPRMGIIALTLLDTEGYRQAAITAGADDFVAKDTLNTTLIPTIERVAQTKLEQTHSTTKKKAQTAG